MVAVSIEISKLKFPLFKLISMNFRFSFASSKSFVDLSFLFLFMRFSRLKIGFRIISQKSQLTLNLFVKIDEVKMKA